MKGAEMGAMKEKKLADRRASRRVKRSSSQVADWGSCDADVLRRAVECVAKAGGALRLGYTSDGGAYAVGIYGDGEPYTDYVRPEESIEDYLSALTFNWGAP